MSDTSSEVPTAEPIERKWDVCFSYAGEDRKNVEKVANKVKRTWNVDVFYDRNYENDLWGKDLDKELPKIFGDDGRYCVVFISKDYVAKEWPRVELKIVLLRAMKEKTAYLLPVRFDDAELDELPHSIVYFPFQKKGWRRLAAEIAAKVGKYKPWWQRLPGVITITSAAILLVAVMLLPSRTNFEIADANENGVKVHVSNKGPKASQLVGFRLKFKDLPIKDTPMKVAGLGWAQRKIGAFRGADVFLTVDTLAMRLKPATSSPYLYRDIANRIAGDTATIEIDVRESDDPPASPSHRLQSFPARRIDPFIKKKAPNLSLMPPEANQDHIKVHVLNGSRPVEIGFELSFDEKLPIREAPLLMTGTNATTLRLAANSESDVLLNTWELPTQCDPLTSLQPKYDDIKPFIPAAIAVLKVRIRYLDGTGETSQVTSEPFPAQVLLPFIEKRVTQNELDC